MPSFADYARKAFKKLELDGDDGDKDNDNDDEYLNSYWTKYKRLKTKFDLFVQLKLLIAPIIEYIILLDRLIYLYEINNTESESSNDDIEHHLVKIFDATQSPRCHALISFSK
jgi:hypothetical protein